MVSNVQLKRCFMSMFNATQDIVGNISYYKGRGAGETKACYSDFSINPTTGFAEGLVEFDEQVWGNKLEERLVQQGAACITILTFQHNDNNQSAGAALARVWRTGKEPGFQQITRGECNPRLLAKAQEIFKEDEEAAESCMFDEKTQEAIKQSLKDMGEAVDDLKHIVMQDTGKVLGSISTVEDNVKKVMVEDTGKVLGSITTVEDNVKKAIVEDTQKVLSSISTVEDSVKKTIAEDRIDTARMLQRTEQAEKISHEMSGRVGGETSKKVKSLKRELATSHQENAKMRRQMQDRDRMAAERENRLYERIRGIEVGQQEIKDNQTEIKELLQQILLNFD